MVDHDRDEIYFPAAMEFTINEGTLVTLHTSCILVVKGPDNISHM